MENRKLYGREYRHIMLGKISDKMFTQRQNDYDYDLMVKGLNPPSARPPLRMKIVDSSL